MSQSWTEFGLCRQVDPELFFPPKGGATRSAKRVCLRCPVLEECREWALALKDPIDGIVGGDESEGSAKDSAAESCLTL